MSKKGNASSIMMLATCQAAVTKANSMLGIIEKGVVDKTAGIVIRLYKSMVRPDMEYCAMFLSHHHKTYIAELEKVSTGATNVFKRLEPFFKRQS